MAEYDSSLPVRTQDLDGDTVDANAPLFLVGGTDGTNFQMISQTSNGFVNVNTLLTAGTANIGKIVVTDGVDDLGIAVDGSLAETTGIQIMGTDGTNAQILSTDTSGVLNVNANIGGGIENSDTFGSINLVKATPATVVTLAGAAIVRKIVASGSGLMKVEVKYGTTAAEVVVATFFNSTANPNVEYEYPAGLTVAGGETILISCTNLEKNASPGSDFTGYATIQTEA